ncbi:hypothetical protein [Actinopolyspora mortivallis]|uniref:hypothetical protein n=1 Tax=Actinopolyspora mortivallis TaxID=33906 RepID=UPI00035E6597|nr:hypothetical protein [Actinopolyspora mortivallis]
MDSTGHSEGEADGLAEPADATTEGVRAAEANVRQRMRGLDELDELPVSEHVARFEAVHEALTHALNRADELLSGASGSGS